MPQDAPAQTRTARRPVSRPIFLAKVLLGLPQVRQGAQFVSVTALSAAAGFAAALILLAPTSGPTGPLGPLEAGVFVAAITGGSLCLVALGRSRRQHAAEFARLARRVGEEKTARSDLRAAFRRLSQSVERAVPEVLATHDGSPATDPTAVPLASAEESVHGRRAGRLLRIARAAALFGGTDLELRRLAVAGPCAEVIEEYRRFAGPEREVLYIEDGGGEWLAAPIDRPLFVLLLRELLDNVFDHAGDWERITVTTEPVAGAIVLRVRDDGRGLAPELLRDLLSAGATGSRAGLGLPLVRAIVEAHGGIFRIESSIGHGTSVTLRFPTHG